MQRFTARALVAGLCAWACSAAAPGTLVLAAAAPAAPAAGAASAILSPQAATLKNGLRLLSLSDPRATVSTFQVWYDTGSRDERPGITGISQLVEALMFQGTKTVGPDEFVRRIQAVGGMADGSTTTDVTAYWEALTPDQLELAARLEADRMVNLAITPTALDSAKTAVWRLRRQNVVASQVGRGLELVDSLAFAGHPYGWPTTGTAQDLAGITLEQAREWYETRYRPDHALVVIAGPTSHADNLKLVQKWFGGLKRGRPLPATATSLPASAGPASGTAEFAAAQFPLLLVGYRTPPDSSADAPVVDVIARLLGGGSASLLNTSLVDQARLAYFTGATSVGRKAAGLLYATAALKAGHDRDSLSTALCAQIEGLAEGKVTDDDLARARNELETQYWFGLDQVQDRASAVATAALVDGDPGALARRLERWRAVTKDDVARVARTWLVPANRTTVWVVVPARGDS